MSQSIKKTSLNAVRDLGYIFEDTGDEDVFVVKERGLITNLKCFFSKKYRKRHEQEQKRIVARIARSVKPVYFCEKGK